MGTRLAAILVLAALAAAGCSNNVEAPSGVAPLPTRPEVPLGLTAAIGDGLVRLSWAVNDPGAVARYKLYYADTSAVDKLQLLDSTTHSQDTVYNLINGRRYYFRVAVVSTAGFEGEMSQVLIAIPGIFSIAVNGGAKYTNSRAVSVDLTAPSGTTLVQLAEDPLFANAFWQNFGSARDFELSDGDGPKTVYARFQLNAGGTSAASVYDSITLDRVATIRSVTENSGGQVLHAGDSVRFTLDAGETGGEASVNIPGLGTIDLNDDHRSGDRTAQDGIYESWHTIPIGTELTDAEITGQFTDAAGNRASAVKAASRLNATFPPDAVTLSGYTFSSREIQLEWTRATLSDFASYRLYRSETPVLNPLAFPVATITSVSTQSYRDTGLVDTTAYYYWLSVFDTRGNGARSDSIKVFTAANLPPDSTVLAANYAGDSLKVELTWLESRDADFASYQVLRDDGVVSGIYNPALVIKIINTRSVTSFTDTVPAAGRYYYRVFVFDIQGRCTGSDMVSITL